MGLFPQDGPAEGVVPPELPGELHLHHILGVVLLGADLLQDDLPFLLQILGLVAGVKDQVAQEVHGPGQVLVKDLAVIAGIFFAGEGVAGAAQLVDLPGDVQGAQPGRAFEGHVLQEMGEAVFLLGLIPGAGIEPHSHRHRMEVGVFFGDDPEAVSQYAFLVHGKVFSLCYQALEAACPPAPAAAPCGTSGFSPAGPRPGP